MVKKYDGFALAGEVRTCAFCGHEFSDEEPQFVEEEIPDWSREGAPKKVCYRCRHYVVNPFVQKCMLRNKEVEALDSCPRFSPRPAPPNEPPDPESPPPSIL